MQLKRSLTPVTVQRLQENLRAGFHDKELVLSQVENVTKYVPGGAIVRVGFTAYLSGWKPRCS